VIPGCVARYRLGHDLKGKPYEPPFTEQEISNYCECVASSMADLLTKEEWSELILNKPVKSVPKSIKDSTEEKEKCIVVEKCKKHLNLAYPEKFQYEQCWKG
jgi:hypothetical protein